MRRITVLGAGLVGGPMALDLAGEGDFEVTIADNREEALGRFGDTGVKTASADLSDNGVLSSLISGADLVVNALPGYMGFETLRSIIGAGRDVVDIAFFTEDPFQLNELAMEQEVTAVVDCGIAPGMSNLLVSHAAGRLDHAESVLIYVGGLPEERQGPWEYRAGFSPIDVIEEYTRPARYIEGGEMVTRPALSEAELLEFPEIGTLEAFNSDGLRTLADTLDIPDMKEKTLRYPGHIDKVAALRDTGFFGREPVMVKSVMVSPIDFTTTLLFPHWKLQPGERDLTVMQIIVEGTQAGQRTRIVYDLLDRYDDASQIHSMARTTGYTATMTVRLLAAGLYGEKGIVPPEFLGRHPECVEFMLQGLADRGMVFRETVTQL